MFVNLKTGKPAFLHAHNGDVTYSVGDPDAAHHTVAGHDFFAAHREATRAEVDEHYGAPAADKPAKRDGLAAARAAKAAKAAKAADKPDKPPASETLPPDRQQS